MAESVKARELPVLLASLPPALERVEAWLAEQFRPEHPRLLPLLRHVARFRGKRIRAAHVLLAGQACGRLAPEHVVVAGLIEMVHTATLVHDDLLDEAQERRGLDCLHVEWGSHASVLLGDWIYARAFLRALELPDRTCAQVLAEATSRVCAGEIHQNLTRGNFALAEADYLEQIDGKTGALYEAGGRLAAFYAGAPVAWQEACARHGALAGRAFQIVDDILDLVGSEQQARKSLGTDWSRGKMTLPLLRLREGLESASRRRLEGLFHGGVTRDELLASEFGPLLRETAAACRCEVQSLLAEANRALEPLPPGPAKNALHELTLFLGARDH